MRQGPYRCRDCQRSLAWTLDDALELGSRCPRCGGQLEFFDRRTGQERRGQRQRLWDPEPG